MYPSVVEPVVYVSCAPGTFSSPPSPPPARPRCDKRVLNSWDIDNFRSTYTAGAAPFFLQELEAFIYSLSNRTPVLEEKLHGIRVQYMQSSTVRYLKGSCTSAYRRVGIVRIVLLEEDGLHPFRADCSPVLGTHCSII